jgi:hypothetical protein
MNLFIMFMIISVTTFGYLASPHPEGSTASNILPVYFRYVPEIAAVIATSLVVVLGVRNRFQYVRPAYWLVFGALALVFTLSAIANMVEPGPLFAALRNYLRALPFFFLPAVMAFRGKDFRAQLLLVLVLAYLQVPLAFEQRALTSARGGVTGDNTSGTIMNGATLSILLTIVACVLTAFYVRKKLSFKRYITALLIVLLPTTLNETKAMVALLPLGIGVTFLIAETGARRMVLAVKGMVVIIVFAAVFIPIYDYYMVPRTGWGIVDFFSDPDLVDSYMATGADIGATERVRRGDALTVPFRALGQDPVHAVFGYGPGNVSDSALGRQFDGEYFPLLGIFLQTLWTIVALELGLLGFALLMVLMWCNFQDARVLTRRDSSIVGVFALGWCGALAVMVISYFYKPLIPNAPASFLFWYFAGVVAAQRMRSEFAAVSKPVTRSVVASRLATDSAHPT